MKTSPFSPVDAPLASAPKKGGSALKWAIAFSVAIHLGVLALKFTHPERPAEAPFNPMLVAVLVNATSQAPTRPVVIAQANLDGGGELDKGWMPSSPLERGPSNAKLRSVSVQAQGERDAQELERQVQELMSQVKGTWKTSDLTERRSKASEDDAEKQAMQIAARIDKQASAYASRPKKVFVGLQAVRSDLAPWVEGWQRKVESMGTAFYPEGARGRVRGSLILTAGIRSDGSVESVQIDQSSGRKLLDESARRILDLSAPFEAFDARMARKVDVVYITRQWRFGPSGLERLESSPSQ